MTDVSKPGKYTLQVVLADPANNVSVKSNVIVVTVVDPAPEKQNPSAFYPPFILTVRLDRDLDAGLEFPMLICQVNISDRALILDNYTFTNEFRVLDSRGMPVPFTERAKKGQEHSQSHNHENPGADISHSWKVGPHDNLCGIESLDQVWDLSKPGRYSVQIVRYDYPDRTPGQKMEEMPLVRSNTVHLTVSP